MYTQEALHFFIWDPVHINEGKYMKRQRFRVNTFSSLDVKIIFYFNNFNMVQATVDQPDEDPHQADPMAKMGTPTGGSRNKKGSVVALSVDKVNVSYIWQND